MPGRVEDQTGYVLHARRSNDLIVPMCRTSTLFKSFLPNMVSEWNGLNVEIKNAGTLSISKSKIKPSLLLWSQMGKHPTGEKENALQQSPCPSVLSPSCYR